MTDLRGHNLSPTADADDLLEAFSRAPEVLDAETAELAITLAKQMRLVIDETDEARKVAIKPLQAAVETEAAPYKSAIERLEEARQAMLVRLAVYLKASKMDKLRNSLGLQVYQKRSVSFEIEDEGKLPSAYLKLIPDTEAIQRAVSAGYEVPGVGRIEKIQAIVT